MEHELYQKIIFYIERGVKGGFETKQQIIDATIGNISNSYEDENLEAIVERITTEKLNSHYYEQSTWDSPTDCDKLDQAFAELESSGILARQHYYCCGTCGYSALESELEENKKAHGGTFYHEQDTEAVAIGSNLYLGYRSTQGTDEADIKIGQEVVAVLERHGLQTQWNGDIRWRIGVMNLDWKKRRDNPTENFQKPLF